MNSISENFTGKIWNIEISPKGELLALEIRDEKSKMVSFSIFHFQNKKWLWYNVEFEETWWLNLQAIDEEKLYLNYFYNDKNPEEKKIVVVDIKGKQVVDELEKHELVKEKSSLMLPYHYQKGSDNFMDVAQFLAQQYSLDIVNSLDYLQTASVIVISYYLYIEDSLANFLLILDEKGNELEHIQLGSELKKVGMHTFFVTNHFLVTIKDKTELKIYTL